MSVESHDLGPVPNLTALSGYGDSYVVPGDEVYVVSEDTDYIYLNTGSNPPADGFNIIKAIFLPGVWQRRSSGGGAGALRFNTVAVGALGSGRLIDTSLAGLVDGTSLAWVESVRDTWRWDATSTATADNISVCNPTANGANPGRFIRELKPDPTWMITNHNWFIRPSTGNNENDGLTDLTALADAEEFHRRTGVAGGYRVEWGPGDYHIWAPEGIGVVQGQNARLCIMGRRSQTFSGSAFAFNTIIYIHGNAVAGQGASTLYTGTVDVVTAQNSATNQPLQITSNGIPVSWTASNLLCQVTTVARRCRITAGNAANIGGTFFAKIDVGAKTATCDYPAVANTYSGNFVINTSTFTPTLGDTFVVETLNTVSIVLDSGADIPIVAESCVVSFGNGTNGGQITLDKCGLSGSVTANAVTLDRVTINGSRFSGTTSSSTTYWTGYFFDITNCDIDGFWEFQCLVGGNLTRMFISNLSGVLALTGPKASIGTSATRTRGWILNSVGIFNVTNTFPIVILDYLTLPSTAEIWGGTAGGGGINGFAPILLRSGATLSWPGATITGAAPPASYFYVNLSGSPWIALDDANGGSGTTAGVGYNCPAWDVATNQFTADRALTPANLQATVAAGGFFGRFFDPRTKCSMVAAQQG